MLRLLLIAALVAAGSGLAGAETTVPRSRAEIALSFAPVVKRAAPAVVTIYTRKIVEDRGLPFAGDPFFERFFGDLFERMPQRQRVRTSLGSGVIVDPAGFVVSNHHVVAGADEITVRLSDRREYDGRVVLADARADLAVVRIEGADDLPALALRDSDRLEVGDLVLAIGDPFGVGQTVTSGIVSGLARQVPGRGGAFIQTDAAINPGNSGGALVDMSGRLVGVPTSILSRSGGSNGIGFAVPSNLVARVIEAARRGEGRLPRPWLGMEGQPVDRALADALGMRHPRGVLVDALHGESPLARAGLAPGDVILSLDGHGVAEPEDIAYRAAALGPGARAVLRYWRDGRTRTARLRLETPPETPPRATTLLRRGALAGLTVERINPAVIAEHDLPVTASGLLVVEVDGPARRSGLRPGDILADAGGRAIEGPEQLRRLLRSGQRLILGVIRDGRRGRVTIRG